MSTVYKFGISIKEKHFINRSVNKRQSDSIQIFINTISTALLLGYIVDKRIELTYTLIHFQERPSNNPLFWKDKKLTLIIRDSLEDITKEYYIRGDIHNVPYIKVPILEVVNAGKNIGLVLECSNNFTSRKPGDVTVDDNVAISMPFKLVSLKQYYNE